MSPARAEPPDEIVAIARQRAGARARRDWARADALRAEIEAAGWKVIDRGTAFALEPAAPLTVEEDGVVRYGSAGDVPSRLGDAPSAAITVELVADDRPAELSRALAGLRAHAPAGTHVVIVANDPDPEQAARLSAGEADLAAVAGEPPEVLWTSERLGAAAARNVGLRRARGAVVVIADAAVEPTGDALTPLARALEDPAIAVAGAFGLVGADLRHFSASPGPAVDALDLAWLACRRADVAALGPLDEKFVAAAHLGEWWSLVLRAGPDEDATPRGAAALDLPLERHAAPPAPPGGEDDRRARRNAYRTLDRFRGRAGLLSGPPTAGPAPAATGREPRR